MGPRPLNDEGAGLTPGWGGRSERREGSALVPLGGPGTQVGKKKTKKNSAKKNFQGPLKGGTTYRGEKRWRGCRRWMGIHKAM